MVPCIFHVGDSPACQDESGALMHLYRYREETCCFSWTYSRSRGYVSSVEHKTSIINSRLNLPNHEHRM
jgi:hypothetical protein